MFTNITTKIYADLDKSVIKGTMNLVDLVPAFMDVLKDTHEYKNLKKEYDNIVDTYRFSGHNVWDSFEMCEFLEEDLFDALNKYAPEGYTFGAKIGNGSDFGYWKNQDNDCADISDEMNISKF